MKKCLSILLLIFSPLLVAEPVQTIVVDDAHIQMGKPEGESGEYYMIKPATSLIIDASQYDFPKYEGMETNQPNAIQIIVDNEHQYTVEWQAGKTKYKLTKENMIPRFQEFKGLKSGEQFIVAIGQLVINVKKKEQVFKVQWVGMGKVQP